MQTIQLQFDFSGELPQLAVSEKKSSKEEEKFVFEFMDMLTAPIITYSTSWASAIPEQLKKDITMSRLIGKMSKEEMATIPETVAYMMTRTFESPMSHEWTNIYLWCSCEYMKQYRKMTDENLKEIIPFNGLTKYEKELLKRLRVWIYEKRRECVKKST